MVKRISLTFISLVILIAGIIAFNKLHYWERSAEIFKINSRQNEGRYFEGRRGNFERSASRARVEGEWDGSERPDFRNMPDSVRQRIFAERGFQSFPDSLRQGRSGTFDRDRDSFEGRGFERGGHRGGDFHRGNSVQLGAVGGFLAVFAAFTVLTIYIEKVINMIRKRKKRIVKNIG